MNVEYMGKQIVVTQKYRDLTQDGLARIQKIVNGTSSAKAKVTLAVDKHRKIADVAVTFGAYSMVANGEAAEMSMALRGALDKIEQQAIRQKEKWTTGRRHPRPVENPEVGNGPESAEAIA